MDFPSAIRNGLNAERYLNNYAENQKNNKTLLGHVKWYCAILDDYTRYLQEKLIDICKLRSKVDEKTELQKALQGLAKNLTTMNDKMKTLDAKLFNATSFQFILNMIADKVGLQLKYPPQSNEATDQKGDIKSEHGK